MQHFKRYIMVYTILPLLVLMLAASYNRFMVTYDYQVSYEGICDPYSESCFVLCLDDDCIEPIFYTLVERRASTLISLCGADITDCANADQCRRGEDACSVTYCDPTIDGDACDVLTQADFIPDDTTTLVDNETES